MDRNRGTYIGAVNYFQAKTGLVFFQVNIEPVNDFAVQDWNTHCRCN